MKAKYSPRFTLSAALLLGVVLNFTSCSKKDIQVPNQEQKKIAAQEVSNIYYKYPFTSPTAYGGPTFTGISGSVDIYCTYNGVIGATKCGPTHMELFARFNNQSPLAPIASVNGGSTHVGISIGTQADLEYLVRISMCGSEAYWMVNLELGKKYWFDIPFIDLKGNLGVQPTCVCISLA